MAPVAAAFLLWLLVCTTAPVASYPGGKVTSACDSMQPKHKHSPQTGIIHNITVDKTIFKPGDRIKVTLSGPRFAGFFIQARNADNLDSAAVGSFSLIDDEISQLLTCGEVQDSAVSQTSKRRKEKVEFYWIAPSDGPQHIQFLTTVVEKYSIYWMKIPGPIVSQSGSSPIARNLLPSKQLTVLTRTALTKRFSTLGCGSSKFCVRNPSSCNPEQDTECFFLSFKRENDSVLIEMSGPGKGYLSFALSHDQWMGDDDAYLCVINGQNVEINPAYTRGRIHPELSSSDILQHMAWRLEDGVLQCSFRRNIRIPSSPERFSMDGSYYIFLADGDADDGSIVRHYRQPLITSKMYNVSGTPEDIGGSRSPLLIKFHGAMMFLAWMTTVSIGVLVARFFKPVWPSSVLCGEKVWFQLHRMLMITTVVLTGVAFVLPFCYRGHWSTRAGVHPYLGCVVMALAVLQPVLAVFRPPPNSPRRLLFNWTHWGSGTVARMVAVAAMFLGMDLQALDLPDPWDTYTLVGFIFWHVFIDILLEVHSFSLLRKGVPDPALDKPQFSINSVAAGLKVSFMPTVLKGVARQPDAKKIADDQVKLLNSSYADEGHTFKKIVLTIYICGNLAFLITFLAAINQI